MYKHIIVFAQRSKLFTYYDPFRKYLILPAVKGILGFALFLLSIALSKYIGTIIGISHNFKIETSDLSMSSLGFMFLFITGFLKNLHR